jgi:NAD(P)-dependent dehydrogenase (short-subunit alcohol dehydrogenase family)
MKSWPDLRGRVCVVTGGARGIGRAVSERFIRAGASVAILDIDPESGSSTAKALESGTGQVAAFSVRRLGCKVGQRHGARCLEDFRKDRWIGQCRWNFYEVAYRGGFRTRLGSGHCRQLKRDVSLQSGRGERDDPNKVGAVSSILHPSQAMRLRFTQVPTVRAKRVSYC